MNRLIACIITALIISVIPSALSAAADKPDATLEAQAKKGDVIAMIKLGKWYAGLASNKDNGKAAVEWFKKSADKGSDDARWLYAGALAEGLPGKIKIKDALKAVEGRTDERARNDFYRKGCLTPETGIGQANLMLAAEMGSEKALFRLANLYMDNKMEIERVSPSNCRTTALSYMEKAAMADYAPAIIWLAEEYAKDDKIKESKIRSRVDRIDPAQITAEDMVVVAGAKNWPVFESMVDIKARSLSQSDYLLLMRSIFGMPEGKADDGKAMRLMSPKFQFTTDTVQIIRFKPIANFLGGGEKGRVCLMDIATGVPTRQLAAARELINMPKISADATQRVINTLTELAHNGYPTAYKDLCKIILRGSDFSDKELQMLCDAYDNGYPDGLDKILQQALRQNKVAVAWLEANAATGTAEMQGTLGSIYAMEDSPFYDKKKAKQWLERAAANGEPAYKNRFPELFENKTAKKPTSDKNKNKNKKKTSGASFQESGLKR